MSDPYASFYAAFLKDHPEALAGVKMVDGEMFLTTATLRQFIIWGLANGVVTHEEAALEMLERLPELDAQARLMRQKP